MGFYKRLFSSFKNCSKNVGHGAPDMASWNSLIAGYAQHGYGWEAIALFKRMQQEGFLPDKYTFISILNARANVGATEMCRLFHLYILECNLMFDNFVANSLTDMYAKCGSLVMARNVFDRSARQHIVTWNALIAGYAQHGHHEIAPQLVQQMKKQECIKPDTIRWNAMLAGLVHYGNIVVDTYVPASKAPSIVMDGCDDIFFIIAISFVFITFSVKGVWNREPCSCFCYCIGEPSDENPSLMSDRLPSLLRGAPIAADLIKAPWAHIYVWGLQRSRRSGSRVPLETRQ